jgi:hypothetical protein
MHTYLNSPLALLIVLLTAAPHLSSCGVESRLCQRVVDCEADQSSAHKRYCSEDSLRALKSYDDWDWECVADTYEAAACSTLRELDSYYRTNAVCFDGVPETMTSGAQSLADAARTCQLSSTP